MDDDKPSDAPRTEWQNRLVRYSILTGLCPLVPIPFLDDFIQATICRHMVRQLLSEHELDASADALEILTATPSGCSLGCLWSVVLYPVKKILKKIFFFLSMKSSADTAAHWFHRGVLLEAAVRRGGLDERTLLDCGDDLHLYRIAATQVLAEQDTSPINTTVLGVFQSSRQLLHGSARTLWRWVKRLGGRRAEEARVTATLYEDLGLQTLQTTLARALWSDRAYLSGLEESYLDRIRVLRRDGTT